MPSIDGNQLWHLRDDSRYRGGQNASSTSKSKRASETFDWPRAIRGFKALMVEVYGEPGS